MNETKGLMYPLITSNRPRTPLYDASIARSVWDSIEQQYQKDLQKWIKHAAKDEYWLDEVIKQSRFY